MKITRKNLEKLTWNEKIQKFIKVVNNNLYYFSIINECVNCRNVFLSKTKFSKFCSNSCSTIFNKTGSKQSQETILKRIQSRIKTDGYKHSDKTKRKLSEAHKEAHSEKGCYYSDMRC